MEDYLVHIVVMVKGIFIDTIRWEHLTYPCYNMLTILSSMLHCITRQEVVPVNDDGEWGDMLHTLERSNIIIGSISSSSSSFTK